MTVPEERRPERTACLTGHGAYAYATLRTRLSARPARGLYFSCRGGMPPAERVRAISTARLWASQPLHLPPIDVVVSDGPPNRTSYL